MDFEGRLRALEQRVHEIEARDLIGALAVRYNEVVDAHDADALRAMFTKDARWWWANGFVDASGIEEVMDALAGRWHTIDASFHVSHGHRIDLDPDDPERATGVLFSHAEVLREDNPMISAVRYDDEYRSHDGTWKFSERKLSFFYYVNANSYVADLVSGTPVRAANPPLAADLGPQEH